MEQKYKALKKRAPNLTPAAPQRVKKTMKCDMCEDDAVISKDGKNACRIHYQEVFKDDKQEETSSGIAPENKEAGLQEELSVDTSTGQEDARLPEEASDTTRPMDDGHHHQQSS